jgi:hypothetical protein
LIDTLTNWGTLVIREEYYDGYFHNHNDPHTKAYNSTITDGNTDNNNDEKDAEIIFNNKLDNNNNIIGTNNNNNNNSVDVSTEMLSVTPYEGFVIKIFQKNNNQKAFINVFHHTIIEDNQLLLCYDPFYRTINNMNNDNNDNNNNQTKKSNLSDDIIIFPLVYISTKETMMLDKNNKEAIVYNLLVSSSYFASEMNLKLNTKIGDNSSINKVIINLCAFYLYHPPPHHHHHHRHYLQ